MLLHTSPKKETGINMPPKEEVIRDRADLYAQKGPKKNPEDMDAEVTDEDIAALGNPDQDNDGNDDELFDESQLDDTDDDGDPLNEGDTTSDGAELDIPGDDDDDETDEENDYYSIGEEEEEEPLP